MGSWHGTCHGKADHVIRKRSEPRKPRPPTTGPLDDWLGVGPHSPPPPPRRLIAHPASVTQRLFHQDRGFGCPELSDSVLQAMAT